MTETGRRGPGNLPDPDAEPRTPLDQLWIDLIAESLRRNPVVAIGKYRAAIEAAMHEAFLRSDPDPTGQGSRDDRRLCKPMQDGYWCYVHESPLQPDGVCEKAAPDPAPLDVERLARALDYHSQHWPERDHDCDGQCAEAIAREYAALASEDRT